MHPNEESLHALVDGDLPTADRRRVEGHVETCPECRETVASLRSLKADARALGPIEPPARVWQAVARGLGEASPAAPQARPWTDWRRLAAAAAVVLVTGVGVRMAWRPANVPPAATAAGPASAQSVEAELRLAEEHYQKAIAGLEQIANAEQSSLDPKTAATLQKNLTVIDQAISESRAALKGEPNNAPAQQSLLESFKSKIALLQDTVALINEMRKGNDAGAARIVSGIKQKG